MATRRTSGRAGGPSSNGRRRGARKDPELVVLGDRLRALRHAAGLTQEQLAERSELHWTYVGQVERGERNLTYKILLRLARGLGVSPAQLVED